MPEYSKACVYKIVAKADPEVALYVGSTVDFRNRTYGHKHRVGNEKNKEYHYQLYAYIRANGGWDAFQPIVIEECPCETKEELLLRELYWFNVLKPSLNTLKPGAYAEAGGESGYFRTRYEAHKEEINAYMKAYYEAHKEKLNAKHKAYHEAHKEERNAYNREKVQCECGETLSRSHLASHRKTAKHQKRMAKKKN